MRKSHLQVAIGKRIFPLTSVVLSPDGQSVAAAGGRGIVWLWHIGELEPLLLEGHRGAVQCLAWSPDGQYLASGSADGTVRIWVVKSGELFRSLERHHAAVRSLAWSFDCGNVATGSDDRSVIIWDVRSGQRLRDFTMHQDSVRTIAWSPDGTKIASGSDDWNACVWDPLSGHRLGKVEGHLDSVTVMLWSGTGDRVASGSDDGAVRIWSGSSLDQLFGHVEKVQSIAWSPDAEKVATASVDGTIRVWDTRSAQLIHILSEHRGSVQVVAWSPDGLSLASGSADNTVRFWNPESGEQLQVLEGHKRSVVTIVWSADGGTVTSGSDDRTIRIWDAHSGRLLNARSARTDEARTVAWSPDGSKLCSGWMRGMVRVYDAASGQELVTIQGHQDPVHCVVWSPDGSIVASASADELVRLWDVNSGQQLHKFAGHGAKVNALAWSFDGLRLASGSDDWTVRIWNLFSGELEQELKGHRGNINALAWSFDGTQIASGSADGTIRISDVNAGQVVCLGGVADKATVLAWSPDARQIAVGGADGRIRLWDLHAQRIHFILEGHRSTIELLTWGLDGSSLVSASSDGQVHWWAVETGQVLDKTIAVPFSRALIGLDLNTVPSSWETPELSINPWKDTRASRKVPRQVVGATVKVILAGDSNAGKTSLARRLVEDRFEPSQSTTHAMRIWKLDADKLHEDGKPPIGQSRTIFLWDLGGQREYQLVNQLFLQDSTVALVVFDPTRGNVSLESVTAWSQRLHTRANPSIRKLLVGSKSDLPGIVPRADIEHLRTSLGFLSYVSVSALSANDEGTSQVREELNRAIDWSSFVLTSRAPAFHAIRNSLFDSRTRGQPVLYHSDLEKSLTKQGIDYEPADLETTLLHLSQGGEIVDIKLRSGERVIVLSVDVLSRYAGSLIQAARTNVRGVPVLEPDRLLAADMVLPGLEDGERLEFRTQEKILLECAVRLMIERGICFEHQGLLVFPTMFDDAAVREISTPQSAPIYYDFNGPIDNIYASLVAGLSVSGKFGPVRLWARYAEFGQSSGGTIGLRRTDSIYRGHLDLYFDAGVSADSRSLFQNFVNDHLKNEGVSVFTGLAFLCQCENEFSEADIRYRLASGMEQIKCQRCDSAYSLFAAAEPSSPANKRALVALKTQVQEKTREVEVRVAAAMTKHRSADENEPIRILHLSDLHFTEETRVEAVLQPLQADLRGKLNISRLDYIVVSGDFAHRCNLAGFDVARDFLQQLGRRFDVGPLKTILVPGNHDYERNPSHFNWSTSKIPDHQDGHQEGNVTFTPNENYVKRFDVFRRFYHSFYSTQDYPIDPAKQFEIVEDAKAGVKFLCLNSAWRVDQFRPERAALNNAALSAALTKSGDSQCGILVWHHAVSGDRKVADTEAIRRLSEAGFRLLLQGDVHEQRDGILNHLDPNQTIHVLGGGAFGAAMVDRPESTPRLYSLLEISRGLNEARIYRRRQNTAEGPYDAHAIYPGKDASTKKGDYTIQLKSSS